MAGEITSSHSTHAAERTYQTKVAAAKASLSTTPAVVPDGPPETGSGAPEWLDDKNKVDKGKPKLKDEQLKTFTFNVKAHEDNNGIMEGQTGHVPESGGLTHVVTHHESHTSEDNGKVKGDYSSHTTVDGQQGQTQAFKDGQTISVVTAGDDDAARAAGLAEASNVHSAHIESTTSASESESSKGKEHVHDAHYSEDVTSDSEATFSHYETRSFTPASVAGKTAKDLGLSEQEFKAVKQITDQGHPATLTHATIAEPPQQPKP